MRLTRFVVALSALAGLAVAAPRLAAQADEYPHAFPRKGATQILDNTRVTVWEVNWLRGVPQPIRRVQTRVFTSFKAGK